jgi:hypothetical protein
MRLVLASILAINAVLAFQEGNNRRYGNSILILIMSMRFINRFCFTNPKDLENCLLIAWDGDGTLASSVSVTMAKICPLDIMKLPIQ